MTDLQSALLQLQELTSETSAPTQSAFPETSSMSLERGHLGQASSLPSAHPAASVQQVQHICSNNPGTVKTSKAATTNQTELFGLIDNNSDGLISSNEMQNFVTHLVTKINDDVAQLNELFAADHDGPAETEDQSQTTATPSSSTTPAAQASTATGPTTVVEQAATATTNSNATDSQENLFAAINSDGNGAISHDELQGFITNTFQEISKDVSELAQLFGGTSATKSQAS